MKRRDRCGLGRAPDLADLDLAVGDEGVRRNGQIRRRRTPPDASGGIVLRTMAGAEEAVVVALMGDRNAPQMGADADDNEPFFVTFLDAGFVALRIGKARDRDRTGLVDLLLAAVADVNRLAAPEHLDVLPLGD